MRPLRIIRPIRKHQRGAVFIVMLVVMIMGVAFFLVSSLSKVTLQTARNEKSADMLAQAKEVVIGYAVNNAGRPGNLPFQDRLVTPTEAGGSPNYDGDQDLCPGLTGCLGRLPWRTLGMSIASPSENDPTGVMPWYAVSANMVDPVGVTFNSELLNAAPPHPWLTVRDMNGNVLSNRVAFIVMIPGLPQPNQSRPMSPGLGGANQYLDRITVPNPCTPPCVAGTYDNFDLDDDFIMGEEHRWIDDPANPGKQIEDASYNFNDKLLYVTIDDLMPLIEKRIAREVKSCLDDYAAASAGKYPWAAPVSDTVTYRGFYNTLFGRVAITPSNALTNDAGILNFLEALNQLQIALNTYNKQHNSDNLNTLILAGQNVKTVSDPAPAGIPNSVAHYAENAGETARDLSTPTPSNADLTAIQTNLSNAYTGLNAVAIIDGSMSNAWSCPLLTTSGNYWDEWKNLVFYQLSDGYKPGSAAACGQCLTLNGLGGNQATVVVAGKMLGQDRSTPAKRQDRNNYLEGLVNPVGKTDIPTTFNFQTFKPSDTANYSTVNDLVLCLDGRIKCK